MMDGNRKMEFLTKAVFRKTNPEGPCHVLI